MIFLRTSNRSLGVQLGGVGAQPMLKAGGIFRKNLSPRRPYDPIYAVAATHSVPNDVADENTEAEDDEEPEVKRMRAEAVLLLSKSPVSARKLAQLARLADGTEARTMVRDLNQLYDSVGRAIRVELVAGGYRMLTRPSVAPWLGRLGHLPPTVRLSPPTMETLTVVAYRQPVSRADIEAVRGVGCGERLRQLMEQDLVRIAGRSEELGRPYLYGTTKRFLQIFGLSSPEALPPIDWDGLQDDLADSEADDPASQSVPTEPTSEDSSTSPQESVVSTTIAPALATADFENEIPVAVSTDSGQPQFDGEIAVDPAADDAQAVIEDEEDDLYEGRVDLDDDDDEDDDYDADWGDDDDDDLDEDEDDDDIDDFDEDEDDDDDDDSSWEEVDDEAADEEWDDDDTEDDEEDWDEDDDDDIDDDDEDDDDWS